VLLVHLEWDFSLEVSLSSAIADREDSALGVLFKDDVLKYIVHFLVLFVGTSAVSADVIVLSLPPIGGHESLVHVLTTGDRTITFVSSADGTLKQILVHRGRYDLYLLKEKLGQPADILPVLADVNWLDRQKKAEDGTWVPLSKKEKKEWEKYRKSIFRKIRLKW